MGYILALLIGAGAQQVGTQKPETHLPLSLQTCTSSGCTSAQKAVTLDANWRWTHSTEGYSNCYTGTTWDSSYCPDPETCAKNCAIDGVPAADWNVPYGVSSDGQGVRLNFVTNGGGGGPNVGSRLYLLDDEDTYYQFKLKNREFAFDVDVSQLPCGTNGAVYFSEMPSDGGSSKYPGNKAGAKYGTGYCDAQCPHDLKFIDGAANVLDWDSKTALGKWGSCCTEMDIWEANQVSSAYTAHTCSVQSQTKCTDPVTCGDNPDHRYDGVCDKDGCDLNPFRFGTKDFYGSGSGFTLDTSKPMTVVTQFITSDNTDTGDLVEIRRKYVQDGKVIETPEITAAGKKFNSITDEFCAASKQDFGDKNNYQKHGGLKAMGEALDRGMTLVMSLWDDNAVYMNWLDSSYPTTKPATAPGVARGTCSPTDGVPATVRAAHPDAHALYSNLKVGTIGSTLPGPSPGPSPTPPSPSPSGNCPGGSLSAWGSARQIPRRLVHGACDVRSGSGTGIRAAL